MTAAATRGPDRLSLADWRRRIGDTYAEVRALSGRDPEAAWRGWQTAREALYREHPQSVLPPDARATFRGHYWPYDRRLRFEIPVEPALPAAPGALALAIPNSGPDTLSFERLGSLEIPFSEGKRRLSLFWMAGYAGGLFLPFRDATNGAETYGAGRYLLDAAKSADLGADLDGRLVLDFNFAYQPSCAFDPQWACPLAPPENRLDLPVWAGERLA